jgi:hypothetical protein
LRECAAVTLGLVLVTVTVLHQQAADLFAVPDRGDPLFSMWRMAWVRHQIVTDPRHLFDANIFYPLQATLTYSDSMLLPALASAPLAWLQIHPVVAYNLMLLASFVLSGLSAYCLAAPSTCATMRSSGAGDLDSARLGAWITAVAFTIAPFRMNHFSHLELQMTMWMPVVLLSIQRVFVDGSSRYASVLVLALVAQWYSSMYYGLFLTLYAFVFAAALAIASRVPPRRITLGLGAMCLAGLLVFPLVYVYAQSTPARGVRSPETVAAFSAVPADYLKPGSGNPVYRPFLPRFVHAERALFPGLVTLLLAAAGAWPPLSAGRIAVMAAGVLAFDGSLGLHGVVYPFLYKIFPAFQSVRVPARFAILVVLTLSVLAGAGARRVLSRLSSPWTRATAAACLTLALVADGWPRYDRLPMWQSPPSIYTALPARAAVLFEFPVHAPADRFAENLPYMYFSMWHWTPMVNGYSGFIAPSYQALVEGTSTFPANGALDYLARVGVTHIALNCRLWEADVCASTMERLDTTPRVRRLARANWYGAPATLYELNRDPRK